MTAAEQKLWKLTLQTKYFVIRIAYLVLIACLGLAIIFSSDSLLDFSAEKHPEMISPIRPNATQLMPPGMTSPSTQDITLPSTHEGTLRPPDATQPIDFLVGGCNIWKGDWIPHPDGPAYTNSTCQYIPDNQDCIKSGRPDLGFLYWRWKPHDCELPVFDARAFLNIVAGKKWAFIGDSLARNNFHSAICSLAQVEIPESIDGYDGIAQWYFRSYNFTLAVAWAPFFVKGTYDEAEGVPKGILNLYLDVVDESWAPRLHNYDYIVLSGGRWYLRTSAYFLQNKLVSCTACPMLTNVTTEVDFSYAYREALRTVFDFLISSKYKGVVFFRTYSPDHWQNGAWNEGGNCTQTAPFKSKSTALDHMSTFMYKVQLEEFAKALQRSSEYSFTLKIVDALHATLLRPDAHPGPYGYFHSGVKNDCVHWCLPGVADTWMAMLLHMLRHR